jgi:hypothetical protein
VERDPLGSGNKMVQPELPTFENICVALRHYSYDNHTKKLQISKVKVKGKKLIENYDVTFDARGLKAHGAFKIHKATRKTLDIAIDE